MTAPNADVRRFDDAAALVAATVLAFFSISGLLALLRWQGLLPG